MVIKEDVAKPQGDTSLSNHAGSYLLQEVLALLDREQVFELLGKAKAQRLVIDLVERASQKYDCNAGEILEEYGARLGICYYCLSAAAHLQDGLCPQCYR